ncbi:MAG TPA: PilZ domain-containing protein [Nitrospiraceae bacterium]|nr:PilZ domain-containing protein [Nitrospiraceae bacterium]
MQKIDSTLAREQAATQLRRFPRVRVSAPFPCSFARIGLKKWLAVERAGVGIVYDVSTKGARVMTEAVITPGDQIAISLRLPNQVSSMFVELATVRWGKEQTYGVEFEALSPIAGMRLQKFLNRQSNSVPIPSA